LSHFLQHKIQNIRQFTQTSKITNRRQYLVCLKAEDLTEYDLPQMKRVIFEEAEA
jgi:hypothetical protein